jgi:hypothetical protein
MHSFSTGEISKYFSCITEIFAMRGAEISRTGTFSMEKENADMKLRGEAHGR